MIFSIVGLVILVLTGSSWGAPQNKTILLDLASDLENWMSLLPDDLKQVPLNLLAIPGELAFLYYCNIYLYARELKTLLLRVWDCFLHFLIQFGKILVSNFDFCSCFPRKIKFLW